MRADEMRMLASEPTGPVAESWRIRDNFARELCAALANGHYDGARGAER